MRLGVLLGMLTVAAAALAMTPGRADRLDDLGAHGRDFKRAIGLEDRGDTSGAIAAYQRLIEKNEDVAVPYYFLGNLYWDTGQKAKALECFGKGAEACPG